jgi:hypothetical protein
MFSRPQNRFGRLTFPFVSHVNVGAVVAFIGCISVTMSAQARVKPVSDITKVGDGIEVHLLESKRGIRIVRDGKPIYEKNMDDGPVSLVLWAKASEDGKNYNIAVRFGTDADLYLAFALIDGVVKESPQYRNTAKGDYYVKAVWESPNRLTIQGDQPNALIFHPESHSWEMLRGIIPSQGQSTFSLSTFVDRVTGGAIKPDVFFDRVTGGKLKEVTLRTPLGRNGLGYQPLKKPLGNNGKNLEKWVSDNREAVIFVAVTVISIAIVQPELTAITWSNIGVVASSDGIAIGVSLASRPGKTLLSSVPSTPSTVYNVPIWPIGMPSTIFEEMKKRGGSGLDDPRLTELLRFVETPTVRKGFLSLLNEAERVKRPIECNPRLIKQVISMNREAVEFGDFVSQYKKKHNGYVGAESDPRFLKIWEKADNRLAAIKEIGLSDDAMKKSLTAMATYLQTARAKALSAAIMFKPPDGKVMLNVALDAFPGHVWLNGHCADQTIFFSFAGRKGKGVDLMTTRYGEEVYGKTKGDVTKTFQVSLAECHKMFGEISKIENQMFYNLRTQNCTTEALKVLKAAGIDLNKPVRVRLPDDFPADGGMWTPAQVSAEIRRLELEEKRKKQ